MLLFYFSLRSISSLQTWDPLPPMIRSIDAGYEHHGHAFPMFQKLHDQGISDFLFLGRPEELLALKRSTSEMCSESACNFITPTAASPSTDVLITAPSEEQEMLAFLTLFNSSNPTRKVYNVIPVLRDEETAKASLQTMGRILRSAIQGFDGSLRLTDPVVYNASEYLKSDALQVVTILF